MSSRHCRTGSPPRPLSSLADCPSSGRGQEDPMAVSRFTAQAFALSLIAPWTGLIGCASSPPVSEEPTGQAAPASEAAGLDQSRVMEELSARSRIPASELRVLLGDCSRTQLAMTLCASRNLVAAELELDAQREAKRASVVPEWRSAASPPWRGQKRSMFLHVLPAVTGSAPLPWQKKCLI